MDQTTQLEPDIEGFRLYIYRHIVERLAERDAATVYNLYRAYTSCCFPDRPIMEEREFNLLYGEPHPKARGMRGLFPSGVYLQGFE